VQQYRLQDVLNADDFRRVALGMQGAVESSHMGHPDFRANGRIFATLHPDLRWGMVKLTPDQQQALVREHRGTFMPESGAWGRQGCTRVRLNSVDEDTLGDAMTLAWQNAVKRRGRPKARQTGRPIRTSRKP
jgi:hypothetical protein